MMKKIKTLGFFLVICSTLFANTIDVYWGLKRYYQAEEQKDYIEIYYLVPANVVSYKNAPDGTWQGNLKTSIKIYDQDDNLLTNSAYVLNSPTYQSLDAIQTNLSDLVRINVPNDSLKVHFQIEDINDSTNFYSDLVDIVVGGTDEKAWISDLMLVNTIEQGTEVHPFYRNGNIMIPKFLNYYPTEMQQMNFYTEFYQNDTLGNYVMKYFITDESRIMLEDYINFTKVKGKSYEALLGGFNISTLASGNYYLYVEVRNEQNELVNRKRTFFQRSNSNEEITENTDINELDVISNNFAKKYDLVNIIHHIDALKPICTDLEKASIDGLIANEDLELMQKYFYSFWKKQNALEPEVAWIAYADRLQYVESNYTTNVLRGYESARGIIYLRYGSSDVNTRSNRNSKYGEYEVWSYENIANVGAVDFVFVNQDAISDDYRLTHSNLRGELYNKYWAEILKAGDY